MPKKWIKLWVAESLRGTIRFDLTSEERGVWFDLLAMAADGRHDGFIAPNNEHGYPDSWIAATLNISLKLLKRVITMCEETNRIERTPLGLHIINWSKYQSEYLRQKPYRDKKSQAEKEDKTLNEYLAELRPAYTDLDLDAELVKFNLYWSEGNRQLKRPKLAFLNWLKKARDFAGDGSDIVKPSDYQQGMTPL